MEGESDNKIRENKQGGFLEIIIFILLALFIMKILGITVSEVIYWFKSFFASVLR